MLLAIETSSRKGSVALIDSAGNLEYCALEGDRNHASALAPTVKSLVNGRWQQIEAYAINQGPGSFTGLRIGLALLKGLNLVHTRPTVPVSSLELLAQQLQVNYPEAQKILPLIHACRREVYGATYEVVSGELKVSPGLEESLYAFDDLDKLLPELSQWQLGGTGMKLAKEEDSFGEFDPTIVPDAKTLARAGLKRFLAGQSASCDGVELRYHQLSAAEVNLGLKAQFAPPTEIS